MVRKLSFLKNQGKIKEDINGTFSEYDDVLDKKKLANKQTPKPGQTPPKKEKGLTIEPPKQLTIDTVKALHGYIKENYSPELGKTTIDCKGLENIDFAGVQLILALQQTAAKDQGQVILKNLPDEHKNLFRLFGAMPFLGQSN